MFGVRHPYRCRIFVITFEPTTALQEATGSTMILITHDLAVIAESVDRVAVMYAGKIVETADVETIFAEPGHPYTQGLLGSIPVLGEPGKSLKAIPGRVPSLIGLPIITDLAPGHQVWCHLHDGGTR